MVVQVVFTLSLEDDGSPSHTKQYARLPAPSTNGYTLRFLLEPGFSANKHLTPPKLYTNYPITGAPFEREKFYSTVFSQQKDNISDPFVDVSITKPGVYEYYTISNKTTKSQRSGSFVVSPKLLVPDKLGNAESLSLLPLDSIVLQTIIPKWLPIIPKWETYFKALSETGYNMVHFAPVNQRGISNSPYAIYDQLALSDDLFNSSTHHSDHSKEQSSLSEAEKESVLRDMLHTVWKNYGVCCVTDIVWNHTACNSEWLQSHPEAGYNLRNSPHLRPAYELDDLIMKFSEGLAEGEYGDPIYQVTSFEDLNKIMRIWMTSVFPSLKLWEFYVVNVESAKQGFTEAWKRYQSGSRKVNLHLFDNIYDLAKWDLKSQANLLKNESLKEKKSDGHRFDKYTDMDVAIVFVEKLFRESSNNNTTSPSEEQAISLYTTLVDEINLGFYQEYDADAAIINDQLMGRMMFLRVSDHGPKLGTLSRDQPLVDTYFTRLPKTAKTANLHPDEMMLANNGWLWNADPLINFAAKGSKAYLRREVICWGDCVKLRFGDGPESNLWLWNHMTKYTQKMARLFNGFRIDNCHSTPLHVASYLLDVARKVNPDLYIFAELFTGSEEKDILFMKTLGIHSLIREGMNAGDNAELCRLVHKYGGLPVGSFRYSMENFPLEFLGHKVKKKSSPLLSLSSSNGKKNATPSPTNNGSGSDGTFLVPVEGSTPHALFMDCTHDNETPHQKRTANDSLPNAAIVAMADCAIGSVKGYDEIVPELLNVVNETRKYRIPDRHEGIIPSKAIFSRIHSRMAKEGYHEINVHQDGEFVTIHRVHPLTHDGYLLIARTAFHEHHDNNRVPAPIVLRNQSVKLIQSASLQVQPWPVAGKARRPSVSHSLNSETDASSNVTSSPRLESLNITSTSSNAGDQCTSPYLTLDLHDSFHHSDTVTENPDENLLIPQTPNQLYHHMGSPRPPESPDGHNHNGVDFGSVAVAAIVAHKLKNRLLGVISGMPSTLDFSTTYTSLTKVHEEAMATTPTSTSEFSKNGVIPPSELQTVINIDINEFIPGSIVMYRTWVNGSGRDLIDSVETENDDDDESFRPITPDLQSTITIIKNGKGSSSNGSGSSKRNSNGVEGGGESHRIIKHDGKVHTLWKSLGIVGDNSRCVEMMVRMGLNPVDSGALWYKHSLDSKWPPGLFEAVQELGDTELNITLFRVGSEELDFTRGEIDVYDVPNFGKLAYCGLQGFVSALLSIARYNDLGHPICSNLREGPWMIDYIINRLDAYLVTYPNLKKYRDWLNERLYMVKKIPSSLIPKYFTLVVMAAYNGLKYRAINLQLSPIIIGENNSISSNSNHNNEGRIFTSTEYRSSLLNAVQSLQLTLVQCCGIVNSTRLFPKQYQYVSSKDNGNKFIGEWGLAAGLPHFSTHHMRCWGRDIFISLRGHLLLLGKYEEAKAHIVAFGSCIKHGLVPNLLDQGIHPRYNSRDAAWFWLYAVQQYCKMAPEGLEFLSFEVKRRYEPLKRYQQATFGKFDDDLEVYEEPVFGIDDERVYKHKSSIAQLIHEILERHARGIKFREYNAGPNLDHAMSPQGFDIVCGMQSDTGFIYGGNSFNCGTWMDKMGDSAKAGTLGKPATPRDGCDVEIVGLCKSTLQWIVDIRSDKKSKSKFPFDGVQVKEKGKSVLLKYVDWNDKIQESFEKCFYVPKDPMQDGEYKIKSELVNRRGIYKDTYGSKAEYADLQLRPNFAIAMVAAPELFTTQHALEALELSKEVLVGPLGIRTLDPSDWNYRGVYDNANDSVDSSIAHGFNYHQGPEWVWVQFFFLRALLMFESKTKEKSRISSTLLWFDSVLKRYYNHLTDTVQNPFVGIPELTNANGVHCHHSCDSQAWSNATMIEFINDLVNLKKEM